MYSFLNTSGRAPQNQRWWHKYRNSYLCIFVNKTFYQLYMCKFHFISFDNYMNGACSSISVKIRHYNIAYLFNWCVYMLEISGSWEEIASEALVLWCSTLYFCIVLGWPCTSRCSGTKSSKYKMQHDLTA